METQIDFYQESPELLNSIMSIGFPAVKSEIVQETEVGVSLSHDDRVCLGVAGQGSQGCDIAPVTLRTRQEWTVLLPDSQKPLISDLVNGGDSVDLAGTRIWAAMEALRKATDTTDVEFVIERREGDSVLFRSTMPDQNPDSQHLCILTFPLKLTRGPERVVAVIAEPHETRNKEAIPDGAKALMERGGLTDDKVYVYRFHPTFKSYSNLSRTFYFSNYFALMGKLRGIGLGNGFYTQAAKHFATGKWSMVTNHSQVRIFHDPRGTDGNPMEVHLWLGNVSGSNNSAVDIYFDWYRVLPNGEYERIAFSEQRITWVKILDHGVAKAHPLPEYFLKAMEEVMMRETPPLPCPLPEKLPEIDLGAELYCAPPGPSACPLLREETYQTALEDADVVGNIHFSDYFAWQGRVRDSYFYHLAPGYYRGTGEQGEFLCRRSRVEHLREAMPFDRVYVIMSLKAVYERGVSLYFEYFRLRDNGKKEKLAFGEHDAVWAKYVVGGKFASAPIPSEIMEVLLSAVPVRRSESQYSGFTMAAGV